MRDPRHPGRDRTPSGDLLPGVLARGALHVRRRPGGPLRPRVPRLLVAALTAGLLGTTALPLPTAVAADGCSPAGGQPAAEQSGPAGADLVLHGHGFGHGMGMSQYGARGAALLGCSAGTILRTYYPTLEPRTLPLAGRVAVELLSGGSRAQVRAEGGPVTWRSGARSAVQPSGSTWTVVRDGGGLRVLGGPTTSTPAVDGLGTAAGARLTAEHRGVVTRTSTWSASGAAGLVRRSSGDVTRFTGTAAGLAVREVMEDDARGPAVQKYLRGLAEMPVTWPVEAQAAQVVAARSFLVGRWRSDDGAYVVRPTTSDQVWTGADQEEDDARHGGRLAQAVAGTSRGTSGTVMTTADGAVARDLLYASSHGGWSESNTYVWGSAQVAHLRPVDDSRWDAASGNPYRSWTVGLSFEQAAQVFGFSRVDGVSVGERGSPARTAGVVVSGVRDGRAARVAFTGQQARDRLAAVAPAVRSSGFTVGSVTSHEGVAVAGDWDGDGLDEVGWWHAGSFTLRDRDGSLRRVRLGPTGGTPVVGDWDGDGRDSVGVFDGGWWYLGDATSSGALLRQVRYGAPGDTPVPGHWGTGPGDGLGVVRGNHWLLRPTVSAGAATSVLSYGRATDTKVPGDWDGDGRDEPGVRRGNVFHRSGAGSTAFGRAADSPVAGRWAGRTDLVGVGREGVVHLVQGPAGPRERIWSVLP